MLEIRIGVRSEGCEDRHTSLDTAVSLALNHDFQRAKDSPHPVTEVVNDQPLPLKFTISKCYLVPCRFELLELFIPLRDDRIRPRRDER